MEFTLKVILSFVVGGLYVSTIVWAAEKLGSKIGGAIAGIPSTLLVSLAFINLAEGPVATKAASAIVPLLITAALFYAYIFVESAQFLKTSYKHIAATLFAVIGWAGLSLAIRAVFKGADFAVILIVALAGAIGFNQLFKHFPDVKPKKFELPKYVYLVRFLVAGSVVSLSVLAARHLGATWGGVAASFPATVASSLYFLNKSQGCTFTEGFVRRLPKAFISTFIFIICLHLLLTNLPTLLCFVLALAAALTYTSSLIILTRGNR